MPAKQQDCILTEGTLRSRQTQSVVLGSPAAAHCVCVTGGLHPEHQSSVPDLSTSHVNRAFANAA